jgi:asparagine synthase (glutamine-hydrolysing)
MQPRIPKGGFFAAKVSGQKLTELDYRLRESGAKVINIIDEGVLFASWEEFPGQGIWSGERGVITYDLDLTNTAELFESIDFNRDEDIGIGQLLWMLYQKYGIDFLNKLRGAFGFALWNAQERHLLLATDAFGIKPVVYSNHADRFIGASRIRDIILNNEVPPEIDLEAIYHYLFFQAICSPVSIYKGIHKLEPGKAILFANSSIKEFLHYDIQYQPESFRSKSHWISEIPREIEKAVNVFVPLSSPDKTGCFLSGGTDSSSISGYYTKLSGRPAKTFSIGFDERGYNELEYAHIAARHFGTEQRDYCVNADDVLSLIDRLPAIYDEPFGNASVVAAYHCARIAREAGVEVLLGGDGGDEIFGGNERYVLNLIFERYFYSPTVLRRFLLEPLVNILPDKGVLAKPGKYIRRANMGNPERFFSYNLLAEVDPFSVLQREYLAKFNTGCFLDLAKAHYARPAQAHDTDRLLYIDMKFTITDNDLRKVNAMAESAGIRVRYPLLDRDLVDFSATIPSQYKVQRGRNRYIFKRAMKGFLPQEILKKQKHGMGLPIAVWLRKDPSLSRLLNDVLFSGKPRLLEYVRPEFMGFLRSNFQQDESPYFGDTLWAFLMLELWLRAK